MLSPDVGANQALKDITPKDNKDTDNTLGSSEIDTSISFASPSDTVDTFDDDVLDSTPFLLSRIYNAREGINDSDEDSSENGIGADIDRSLLWAGDVSTITSPSFNTTKNDLYLNEHQKDMYESILYNNKEKYHSNVPNDAEGQLKNEENALKLHQSCEKGSLFSRIARGMHTENDSNVSISPHLHHSSSSKDKKERNDTIEVSFTSCAGAMNDSIFNQSEQESLIKECNNGTMTQASSFQKEVSVEVASKERTKAMDDSIFNQSEHDSLIKECNIGSMNPASSFRGDVSVE
eukprot:14548534-Ditylum_brightwellii.AAC.1